MNQKGIRSGNGAPFSVGTPLEDLGLGAP